MRSVLTLFAYCCMLFSCLAANAHDGRRLAVVVVDGKLAAHGYNSGAYDQQVSPRPYYNAIHGHWHNQEVAGMPFADANLPSFDVFGPDTVGSIGVSTSSAALANESLTLTLLGASTWTPPAMMPFGAVDLLPLSGETIMVDHGAQSISTDTLGSLVLADLNEIDPAAGKIDLDLEYLIEGHPSNSLYVLEWSLSTSAPGVASSDSIYTILSPQGALHHQALHLEAHLGAAIAPEPAAGSLLAAYMALATRWRKRRLV